MFDDDIKNPGNVPGNLPMGEPEDIFSATDDATTPAPPPVSKDTAQPVAPPAEAPQTALGAGVLQPKNKPEPAVEQPADPVAPPPVASATPPPEPMQPVTPARPDAVSQLPPDPMSAQPPMTTPPAGMQGGPVQNHITEPLGNRHAMLWIILSVVVVVLGIGSVWIYFSIIRPDADQDFFVPEPDEVVDPVIDETVVDQVDPVVETPDEPATTTEEDPFDIDENILLGEPLDTDGDGLTDVREAAIKTDPLKWDTDEDELGDGDEVTIWKTDPLKDDTDGDGYKDGPEIRNGYSPTGPGKLFEPPSTTSTEQ